MQSGSGIISVEWCSFCNKREANGRLTIEEPVTKEHLSLPCCLYCARNPDLWEDGKIVLNMERPDE